MGSGYRHLARPHWYESDPSQRIYRSLPDLLCSTNPTRLRTCLAQRLRAPKSNGTLQSRALQTTKPSSNSLRQTTNIQISTTMASNQTPHRLPSKTPKPIAPRQTTSSNPPNDAKAKAKMAAELHQATDELANQLHKAAVSNPYPALHLSARCKSGFD